MIITGDLRRCCHRCATLEGKPGVGNQSTKDAVASSILPSARAVRFTRFSASGTISDYRNVAREPV